LTNPQIKNHTKSCELRLQRQHRNSEHTFKIINTICGENSHLCGCK